MKKIARIIILTFFCGMALLPATRTLAQNMPNIAIGPQPANEPTLTDSSTVAMIFGRLTGHMPDFSHWAQQTDAYKSASPFEQPTIEKNQIQQLQNAYATLDITVPVIVKTPVKLSAYDAADHGFFITNFKKATFFPEHYAGKFYALVPQGLMDKQWLPITNPTTVTAIEKALASSKDGMLPMFLYLTPVTADTTPATIYGEKYWPIAVNVGKMMLFSPDNQTLLWHNFSSNDDNKTRQSIMSLYQ